MILQEFLNSLREKTSESKSIKMNQNDLDYALNGQPIPGLLKGFTTLTKELLKLLTDDSKYYNDFYTQLIEKNNTSITLESSEDIGIKTRKNFNKFKIIDAMEYLDSIGDLSEDEQDKLKLLKTSVEFNSFIEKYQDRYTSPIVEGKFVQFPVKYLIEALIKDEVDANNLVKQETHHDYKLPEFMYILDDFLDTNKILDKYYIPKEVSNNLSIYKENVDICFINRCLDYQGNYLNRVVVNKELKDEIYKDINNDFDKLERAFYIYYRMCKILTYDEEQFAKRKIEDYEIKHTEFNRLKEVTPTNNKVICYEFNAIYAKLLEDEGIIHELDGDLKYGRGHASLFFRVDDLLIHADSTIGLIESDMAFAKNGLILRGFKLENKSNKDNNYFNNKLDNVYEYISKTDKEKYYGTIRDLSKLFFGVDETISFEEKVNLFIIMSTNSNLPPIDKVPYQIKLRKEIFTKKNNDDTKFAINFISNKEKTIDEKYTVTTLISYNEYGLNNEYFDNGYIAIKSNGAINDLTYEEVKYKLKSGEYKTMFNDTRTIPGFTLDECKGIFNSTNTDNNKTHS